MQIFDFNVHLSLVKDNGRDVNKTIEADLALREDGLIEGLEVYKSLQHNIQGANFQLFNTNLFDGTIEKFKSEVNNVIGKPSLTALVDFRRDDVEAYIDRAVLVGIKAIMFNSYLQSITEDDFKKVVQVCKLAESKGLAICIDGSYGTSKMYRYLNLPLACEVSEEVTEVPIIIIHSGGANIIEAMLLALEKSNIFLETSFSLNFYLGSSLEKDYAFAYKKIGTDRVLFGSDYPYHNYSQSLQNQLNFFEKHNFSNDDIERILYNNAIALIDE